MKGRDAKGFSPLTAAVPIVPSSQSTSHLPLPRTAQAEIMFNPDLQFVVFLGPWSVGKTLCMREKARQLGKPHVRILGVQPEFCRKGGGVETPCRMGCGNSSVNMNHY